MRGALIGLQIVGACLIATGTAGFVVAATTPPILLQHPDPHSNSAATTSLSAMVAPILAAAPDAVVAAEPPVANAPAPAAVERRGLWIEAPELHIALPVRPGSTSGEIPLGAALVYPGTASPGTMGNSYVYAHGYWDSFGGLLFARQGDAVTLHDYDTGTMTTFTVTRIIGRIRATDQSWIHAPASRPTLTLQTCVGYDLNSDRYVVQAAQA